MSLSTLALRAHRISASAYQLQSHPGIFHAPNQVDSIMWIQLEWLATSAAALAGAIERRQLRRPGIRNLTPPQAWTRTETGSFQITQGA